MAQCNLCVTDFSISSGGRTDVRRHQESARHAKLALRRRVGSSSVLRFAILAKVGAGIRHYSDIQCCQRASWLGGLSRTDFRLLLSEEFGYFPTNMFSAEHVRPSIILLYKAI